RLPARLSDRIARACADWAVRGPRRGAGSRKAGDQQTDCGVARAESPPAAGAVVRALVVPARSSTDPTTDRACRGRGGGGRNAGGRPAATGWQAAATGFAHGWDGQLDFPKSPILFDICRPAAPVGERSRILPGPAQKILIWNRNFYRN